MYRYVTERGVDFGGAREYFWAGIGCHERKGVMER